MHSSVEELTPEQVVSSWALLDYIIEKAEERKKLLRVHLLSLADERGEFLRNEGRELKIAGSKIIKERRKSQQPDEVLLRRLLDSKRIRNDSCFDSKVIETINLEKLKTMIHTGLISEEELKPMYSISFALRMKLNTILVEFLENMYHRGTHRINEFFDANTCNYEQDTGDDE